jgi:hypothetical protein
MEPGEGEVKRAHTRCSEGLREATRLLQETAAKAAPAAAVKPQTAPFVSVKPKPSLAALLSVARTVVSTATAIGQLPAPPIEERLLADGPLRIESRPGRGRGIFATRPIPALSPVLRDTATCWYPQLADDLGATIPGLLETGPAGEERDPFPVLLQLAPWGVPGPDGTCPTPGPFPSRTALLLPVLEANALGLSFDDDARADRRCLIVVAALAAMANHSCAPTCGYVGDWSGGRPVVRLYAEAEIGEGEEVTISYVPRDMRKRERQERLRTKYGFTCTCVRCAAPWDDTVVFACPACAGRVYLGALACADCGAAVAQGATAEGGPWDRARTAALKAGPIDGFAGLHSSDMEVYEKRRQEVGGLWGGMARENSVRAAGVSEAFLSNAAGRVLGTAARLDFLFFAGYLHAMGGQLCAAQVLFSEAAAASEAVLGRASESAAVARAFAASPPTTRHAVEAAESQRARLSASWMGRCGMPTALATRWMEPFALSTSPSGREADSRAAAELAELTRAVQSAARAQRERPGALPASISAMD